MLMDGGTATSAWKLPEPGFSVTGMVTGTYGLAASQPELIRSVTLTAPGEGSESVPLASCFCR